jgi:GNAT superfamily N-acetyltransferase
MSEVMRGTHRFLVRDATPQDLPYVRAWLPDALGGTPAAAIGLATDAATGALAGCAALRVFVDRVGRFLLFVDPAFRRRGCGMALLQSVQQAARLANVQRLLTGHSYPAEAADADSAAALAFFRARGLSVGQDILGYRAELKAARAILEPLYLRSVRDLTNPQRARIVTADLVDRRALADFVVRHLGGFPEEIADRLSGHGQAFSLATSQVALLDQRIVGAFLTVVDQGQRKGFIETRAVDPEHRGGWINLAMMHLATAAGDRLGLTTIEFEGEAQDRDTSKLARRLGASQVARRQCWGCPVAGSAEPAPIPTATGRPTSSGWHAEALRSARVDGQDLRQLQESLLFDSLNDVIQVLTERSVESVSATNHVRRVILHLKVERRGTEVFDRATGLKNCLLLLALPKSASQYIFSTLAAGLGLDKVAISTHGFPEVVVNPQLVVRLAVPGTICHSSADARLGNLALIQSFVDRLVVHVRDPRQAILSAVHHLNDLHVRQGPSHVASFGFPLPNDYFEKALTEQIDWMIANALPEFGRWIEVWLDAAANPLFRPRVLFTRYEDLHADPAAYFARLLGFYEVAWGAPDFRPPVPQAGSQQYRKGMTDEWRTILTPAQQAAACALVSARVRERFAWPAQ